MSKMLLCFIGGWILGVLTLFVFEMYQQWKYHKKMQNFVSKLKDVQGNPILGQVAKYTQADERDGNDLLN